MKAIISVMVWIAGALLTIALFFAMLLTAVWYLRSDRKRKHAHAQCFWWADALVGLNPFWELKVSGLENIDTNRTYVMVANHQSLADIIVLYKIKAQFKWVSKESLFNVPVVGWCLRLARHIRLARGKFSSIKKVYRDSAMWLENGVSVLFFPEGTRSKTEEMNEFQNGAFKLAIKEKKPILPIVIGGTKNAIQKGSWLFSSKANCFLKVLPAVETEALEPRDFRALKEAVYKKLGEAL
jgi:1-acyl-sn-glycerol-3-phosphate acyltransferase